MSTIHDGPRPDRARRDAVSRPYLQVGVDPGPGGPCVSDAQRRKAKAIELFVLVVAVAAMTGVGMLLVWLWGRH